jgi:hypothetical protein
LDPNFKENPNPDREIEIITMYLVMARSMVVAVIRVE